MAESKPIKLLFRKDDEDMKFYKIIRIKQDGQNIREYLIDNGDFSFDESKARLFKDKEYTEFYLETEKTDPKYNSMECEFIIEELSL
jgi:hypothetical protein